MDKTLRRNKSMYFLSLIVCIVIIISALLYLFASETGYYKDIFVNIAGMSAWIMSVLYFIGYVAVYVLWVPVKEERLAQQKRPRVEIILIIVSIAIPLVLIIISTITFLRDLNELFQSGQNYVKNKVETMAIYTSITMSVAYLLRIVAVSISIAGCEKPAKKILITYLFITTLQLVKYTLNNIFLYGYGKESYDSFPSSYLILYFGFVLVGIFTVLYTKAKTKEKGLLQDKKEGVL